MNKTHKQIVEMCAKARKTLNAIPMPKGDRLVAVTDENGTRIVKIKC